MENKKTFKHKTEDQFIDFHPYLDFAKACLICANEDMNVERMDKRSLYASDSSSPRENDFCFLDVMSFTTAVDSIPISDMLDVIAVAHSSLLSLKFTKKNVLNFSFFTPTGRECGNMVHMSQEDRKLWLSESFSGQEMLLNFTTQLLCSQIQDYCIS